MTNKWTVGLAALALIAASAPARAQITGASVTGGRIAGVAADGLGEFKGIPFAAICCGVSLVQAMRCICCLG